MNDFKILLISIYVPGMTYMYEDLGLCYVGAFLRKKGYEVIIKSYIEPNIDINEIVSLNSNLIGFSLYDLSKTAVFKVINEIKRINPTQHIFVGGNSATFNGENLMKENLNINYIIRGEGEQPTYNLAEKLRLGEPISDVRGIIYREDNMLIRTEDMPVISDLDALPMPARDILLDRKLSTAAISTSRGCKGNCSFCACKLFWGSWRGRSADSVVDEIEYLNSNYGIKAIHFIDGSFEDPDKNLTRLQAIVDGILERKIQVSYYANFRATIHRKATPSLMNKLAQSGLCGALIGIESFSDQNLRYFQKTATAQDNHATIQLFAKHGIHIEPGFILFNPYTTFEDLYRDMKYLKKYGFASNPNHICTRYALYKKCAMYERIQKDGLLCADKETEYGYHFIDRRIETLSDYLMQTCNELNEETDLAMDRFKYYCSRFMSLLAYYQRNFDDTRSDNIITRTKKEVEKVLDILNDTFSNLFFELLDLAQKNWNVYKAQEITSLIVKPNVLSQLAAQLDLHKNKLMINLSRNGLQDELIHIV